MEVIAMHECTKKHLHEEQFSLKINWRLAERLI